MRAGDAARHRRRRRRLPRAALRLLPRGPAENRGVVVLVRLGRQGEAALRRPELLPEEAGALCGVVRGGDAGDGGGEARGAVEEGPHGRAKAPVVDGDGHLAAGGEDRLGRVGGPEHRDVEGDAAGGVGVLERVEAGELAAVLDRVGGEAVEADDV